MENILNASSKLEWRKNAGVFFFFFNVTYLPHAIKIMTFWKLHCVYLSNTSVTATEQEDFEYYSM